MCSVITGLAHPDHNPPQRTGTAIRLTVLARPGEKRAGRSAGARCWCCSLPS
jgi:hypothetical protein